MESGRQTRSGLSPASGLSFQHDYFDLLTNSKRKSSKSLRTRLHWCPTGPFVFLPLHAAGIYDTGSEECCSDYVVSSYTPTLTGLLRAQESNPSFSKLHAKLSLIAATKAQNANLPTLWNVEEEIMHVRATAKEASVSVDDSRVNEGALITNAAEAFNKANMVHIACHGVQDTYKAVSSGFYLADGNLTVSHLMELDLKDAFFAFLSACETAKGDIKQPDQTVHLAAAMLFVGFRCVVATMW
jgi:CHAT domain-containing protein